MRDEHYPDDVDYVCDHCGAEQEAEVKALEGDSVYVECAYCKEHAYVQVIF